MPRSTDYAEPIEAIPIAMTSTSTYAMAIKELQQLESEPLCHRLAARLLVHNCHILDGKDEATVLMDSGRALRDFVDSYAASLAICDLERGSFVIPKECKPFRERSLAQLPATESPKLHVSTQQISDCLHGLSQSDAAWNTWVNYRHKALRFCEAARSDNEKDHHLRVFQKATEIISKLTEQVDEELVARAGAFESVFEETSQKLGSLEPRIDHLRDQLGDLDMIMSQQIHDTVKSFSEAVTGGFQEAKALEAYMAIMLKSLEEQHTHMTMSHETALQTAAQHISNEAELAVAQVASAVATFAALQHEMELSRKWAAETSNRQAKIQSDMERLENIADSLFVKYSVHEDTLDTAHQRAQQLSNTLEKATNSASSFQNYVSRGFGLAGWWPYIYCPAASLFMGSYGLAPSAARNFVLISIGEVAGLVVSKASAYAHIETDASLLRGPHNVTEEARRSNRVDFGTAHLQKTLGDFGAEHRTI